MTLQKNVQEVLRLMADDLQDLRANLAALAAQPCTAAVALAAKNRAIEQNHKSYASLLEKNESRNDYATGWSLAFLSFTSASNKRE